MDSYFISYSNYLENKDIENMDKLVILFQNEYKTDFWSEYGNYIKKLHQLLLEKTKSIIITPYHEIVDSPRRGNNSPFNLSQYL